jgi:hypothetical protein
MTAYSASNAWTWTTSHTVALGTWGTGVWARQQGSSASYEAYYIGTFQLTSDACSAVTLNNSGGNLTANSVCPSPLYRFWESPPGGAWTVFRDWQSAPTATFQGSGPSGVWEIGVWARDAASTSSYDSYSIVTAVVGSCQEVSASTGGMDTAYEGQTISVSAGTNTACPLPSPEYQFWLLPPGGTWTVEQAYGGPAYWNWNTAGFSPGFYQYGLWAKSISSPAAYDGYFIGSVTVRPGQCGAASIATSLLSPQQVGTPITTLPSSSGVCGASGWVKYWELPANSGAWKVLNDYSLYGPLNAPSNSWNTTGLAPGPYRLGVWFHASNPYPFYVSTYDSYAIITFWLD